jgi:hypothetical protein
MTHSFLPVAQSVSGKQPQVAIQAELVFGDVVLVQFTPIAAFVPSQVEFRHIPGPFHNASKAPGVATACPREKSDLLVIAFPSLLTAQVSYQVLAPDAPGPAYLHRWQFPLTTQLLDGVDVNLQHVGHLLRGQYQW